MPVRQDEIVFREALDRLVARAVRSDVPRSVAEEARGATQRALGLAPDSPAPAAVRRRAEAYFSAVLRRSTVRGMAGARAAARLVAASVVADLREGGRDELAIWRELERGWGARLPNDLLEEYRLRLCG